jgi:hypothetical protein
MANIKHGSYGYNSPFFLLQVPENMVLFFQKKGKCRIMIVAKVRKRNEKTEQQQQQTSGRRI